MNIYIQEVKMAYKSAISWTIGMIILCFFFMALFPSMSADAAAMNAIFSKFPEAFLKALGISNLDMSTLLGFYGLIFNYVTLIGAIFAMKLGLGVLSEEVRCKTSDFLVVKPVNRVTIVTAKLLTVLTLIVIQNILYVLCAVLFANAYETKGYDFFTFLIINGSLFLVQLFFVGFGFLLSVLIKKIKTVLPITMGVVFGFFIIQLLNETLGEKSLTYITPFAYFNMADMIKTGQLNGTYVLLDIVLVLIFVGITYWIYQHKDMPSV